MEVSPGYLRRITSMPQARKSRLGEGLERGADSLGDRRAGRDIPGRGERLFFAVAEREAWRLFS